MTLPTGVWIASATASGIEWHTATVSTRNGPSCTESPTRTSRRSDSRRMRCSFSLGLKKLNVPVYGTRLNLGLVKPKLKEHRILRESDLREVRVGDSVQLGPFRVETVAVCHSIPDAVALAIETPVGRVIYTSDFKLDPDPPDGHPTDMERFRRLGDDGVL